MTWRTSLNNVDTWRKGHLAVAEWIDAWRLVPRLLVGGYGWVVYKVIVWYMGLEPKVIEGCTKELAENCLYQAPTTTHAALVTAVIGIAAAIFAFYTNTGKKWNGFTYWNKETPKESHGLETRKVVTESVYRPDDEGDGG